MFIHIIRHGETYGNINGDGFSETDLTPLGEEQALLLGERFKGSKIDKIYVSPLIRAVKTARAIATFHKSTSFIVTPQLFEQGTEPDYKGVGEEKIKELYPMAQVEKLTALGEENDEITYKRARAFIDRVKSENPFDSHIVVVAHGSFNSFLVSAALDMPLKEHFNFSHVNTGVTLIQYIYEDDNINIRTKLKYLNDTSHLHNFYRDLL